MVTGVSTAVKSVTVKSITVRLVYMFKQMEIRQRVVYSRYQSKDGVNVFLISRSMSGARVSSS